MKSRSPGFPHRQFPRSSERTNCQGTASVFNIHSHQTRETRAATPLNGTRILPRLTRVTVFDYKMSHNSPPNGVHHAILKHRNNLIERLFRVAGDDVLYSPNCRLCTPARNPGHVSDWMQSRIRAIDIVFGHETTPALFILYCLSPH
jgi:hypothetical protein